MFEALESDPRYEAIRVRRYDWNQSYPTAEYRRLMLSYSVTQMMETTKRAGLLDDIEALIRTDYAGIITRPIVVTLTTASLA